MNSFNVFISAILEFSFVIINVGKRLFEKAIRVITESPMDNDKLKVEEPESDDSPEGKLRKLLNKGEQALDDERIGRFPVKVWLAAVKDLLIKTGLKDSTLFVEFDKIFKSINEDDIENDKKQDIITKTKYIIEYATIIPREPAPPSSDPETIEFRQANINEEQLDRHIQSRITETYLESKLARVQGIVLLILVIFAALGVIRLATFNLDLNQLSDDALQRAKQDISALADGIISDIDTLAITETKRIKTETDAYIGFIETAKQDISSQTDDIISELDRLAITETTRIETETDAHIEDLKEQMAPNLEKGLTQLKKDIAIQQSEILTLESRLDDANDKMDPLADAVEIIYQDTDDRWLLPAAIMILNRSTGIILAFGVVSAVALFFSLVSAIVSWNKSEGKMRWLILVLVAIALIFVEVAIAYLLRFWPNY